MAFMPWFSKQINISFHLAAYHPGEDCRNHDVMSSAGFILAINFFVGGFFALIFGLIAAYDRAYQSARWFSFAYMLGMASVAFEFILPFSAGYLKLVVVAIFASFLAALLSGIVGLSRRYVVAPPVMIIITIFVISVAINIYIYDLPRHSFARMILYQGPYMVVQLLGAFIVFRQGRRRVLDVVTGVFLSLSALNYVAKPFVARAVGGPGDTPVDYIDTSYALYSQTMGAILALALGLLFVTIYMRDMLADMRAESQTDRLSNLLNRRGFEAQVDVLLKRHRGGAMPVCMIICDLDHFKQINDEFGHAAGDQVIAMFSGLLRTSASVEFVVGRIGGEEFAVFLPSATSSVARLFAEGVRSAFAGMQVKDVPTFRRFTASFGVAEMIRDEDFSSLLRRADTALYEAKRDGRNRVCVAATPLEVRGDRTARRDVLSRA